MKKLFETTEQRKKRLETLKPILKGKMWQTANNGLEIHTEITGVWCDVSGYSVEDLTALFE